MWILFSLIWWVLAGACALAVRRTWGGPAALGVLIALVVSSWILPLGGLLTAAAACAVGYRAELHEPKRLSG